MTSKTKTGEEPELGMAHTHRQVGARTGEHGVDRLPVPVTIPVPAGPFWMGSSPDDPDAYENEKPRRQVDLPAYEIGRYPVTNAEYACFLAHNPDYPVPRQDEGSAHPHNWDSQARSYPKGQADHPVVLVSWEDAMAYCRWLRQVTGEHHRLPTEEEWEKAARGGLPAACRYPWGDTWQADCCNTQETAQNGTTPVREFERTNHSPLGAIDMAGNVWEWTDSWYERYPDSRHRSLHYGRLYRVVRGGSWRNAHREARGSCRGRYKPGVRRPYLGFRVVSDVVDVPAEREPSGGITRVELRKMIVACFNASELRTLCFDLGVEYDDLPGEGRADKARELVAYFERRGRIRELEEHCRRARPDVSPAEWEETHS